MLKGKRFLVGVTGSIAAYKAAELVRLLIKAEAEVQVILTPAAKDFITPTTLSALSHRSVLSEFSDRESGQWNNHVELSEWADALLIAPASANTIAKMATGQCDNLLLAIYLSARCPTFFAPAMDLEMWQQPSTQRNVTRLVADGNHLINPENGELASGLSGWGRMAEPENIQSFLNDHFSKKKRLAGKRALVTAGPTHEAIDPVRFIGNRSSGKMGFSIAEALAQQGALVDLVTGPTQLDRAHPRIQIHRVTSAQEMFDSCHTFFSKSDIVVLSAAVADFRPAKIADHKIKKGSGDLNLVLEKTPDIAATLGNKKKNGQFLVGFALETENEKSNAQKKLKQKNLDMIILNSLNDSGAAFEHDTNKVTILKNSGEQKEFPLKPKNEVAIDIVNSIIESIDA